MADQGGDIPGPCRLAGCAEGARHLRQQLALHVVNLPGGTGEHACLSDHLVGYVRRLAGQPGRTQHVHEGDECLGLSHRVRDAACHRLGVGDHQPGLFGHRPAGEPPPHLSEFRNLLLVLARRISHDGREPDDGAGGLSGPLAVPGVDQCPRQCDQRPGELERARDQVSGHLRLFGQPCGVLGGTSA
ncbi:hypothetical protein [Streptomyces sp. IBSBF 3136]|uniref:hypothetical protein n=1 Tax=Streptomyces sp. IBSBF 3136 TaxID=2903524 RepID=UPI002FDC5633